MNNPKDSFEDYGMNLTDSDLPLHLSGIACLARNGDRESKLEFEASRLLDPSYTQETNITPQSNSPLTTGPS